MQRAVPPRRDQNVVAPPAIAFFKTRLRHPQAGFVAFGPDGDVNRHRANRVAVGRQPECVGDEKAFVRRVLHDRPAQHPAAPPAPGRAPPPPAESAAAWKNVYSPRPAGAAMTSETSTPGCFIASLRRR